ncbi:MAG TPA: PAS domain S-box protein [Candidatus Acidoferrales bacterium]|nr:PAS domain S-box protein [Candidatus Acidoferrales bacterium]
MKNRSRREAAWLALIYLIGGAAWVAFSEAILRRFTSTLDEGIALGAIHALVFVVVTGCLLYLIWRRLLNHWQEEMDQRETSEKNLRRTERALKTISACNGVLVRATNENTLLAEICQVVVDQGGYRMAWVGFAEHDESKSVRIPAHAGADGGFLERFSVHWDENNPRGRGPTGVAIRTGRVAISHDFQNDPNMSPWRQAAAEHGFACSIALPLRDGQEIFGVLTIYAAETNAFNSEEVELLTELAGDLAYGIKALRTRLERAQAERAQQLFRTLVDRSSDAIHAVDPATGRFLDANESACQSLGYTRGELLGLSAMDVVEGMDPARFESIKLRLGEAAHTTLDVIHRRKNGTTYPAEVSLSLVKLDREYLLAIARDVTQRRQAEATLRESEQRYRQLFEMESDAVILVDCETHRYVDVNKSAQNLYGYSREEFLQLKPEDVSDEPELTRATIGTPHAFVPLRWHRRKNGQRFAVEITANQIDIQGRRIELATLRDITVRQSIMDMLQETTSRLLEAQRIAGLGSFGYDLVNGSWTGSEVLHDLLGVVDAGFTRDAASWLQIIHPEDRARVDNFLQEVVAKRAASFDQIYRIVRPNDLSERWVHGLGKPIFDQPGRILQIVGTIQDITQSRHTEESLRQSEAFVRKVLDSLTAHIAVLDERGTIVAVNRAWQHFAAENGGATSRTLLGANYLEVCQQASDDPAQKLAVEAHTGIRAVMTGRQSSFQLEYPCHSPATHRWFAMQVWPLGEAGQGVVVAHEDITTRKIAEAQLHLQSTVLTAAANGIEAAELAQAHRQQIALLLTDLVMPGGLNGQELARQLQATMSNLKVIYITGYSPETAGRELHLRSGENFVQKPFMTDHLLETLRRSLDGNERAPK